MNFDPLTFALEIINFLVLLWLLKRLLYKPIRRAIAERRDALHSEQQRAEQAHRQALANQREYEAKLEAWQAERAERERALEREIAERRERARDQLERELDEQRQRRLAALDQQAQARERRWREQAVDHALSLSGRVLNRLAGSALDEALLRVLLTDLAELPEADAAALHQALERAGGRVQVTLARPLSQAALSDLRQRLCEFWQRDVTLEQQVDEALLSGLRLRIGAQVLSANLSDELLFLKRGLQHAAL